MAMTKAQKHRAAKTRERALARAAERRRLARVARELAEAAKAAAVVEARVVEQPIPTPPPAPQPRGGLMSNSMLMPAPGKRLSKATAMAAVLRANERIRGEPISVAHDD